MEGASTFTIFVIGLALVFDFINGFHDAANSIATVVSTRVLKPRTAVLWAAFFNFVAFLFFGDHVAATIGKGVIEQSVVDPHLLASALIGAIVWNLFTWYYGIPSSSSHALIGGLVGSAVAKSGVHALKGGGLSKVGASIIGSPLLGFAMAFALFLVVARIAQRFHAAKVNRASRVMQLVSAALYSIGHGGNDAQKTMGIITVLLFSTGQLKGEFHVPMWVVLVCHLAMGLGTMFGGWRIVETMGMKITKLRPIGGFCAETAGAITIFGATALGLPVSTTHIISGSIMGVGAVNKVAAVRWGVAERIIWAWILTIPCAAFVSGLAFWALDGALR